MRKQYKADNAYTRTRANRDNPALPHVKPGYFLRQSIISKMWAFSRATDGMKLPVMGKTFFNTKEAALKAGLEAGIVKPGVEESTSRAKSERNNGNKMKIKESRLNEGDRMIKKIIPLDAWDKLKAKYGIKLSNDMLIDKRGDLVGYFDGYENSYGGGGDVVRITILQHLAKMLPPNLKRGLDFTRPGESIQMKKKQIKEAFGYRAGWYDKALDYANELSGNDYEFAMDYILWIRDGGREPKPNEYAVNDHWAKEIRSTINGFWEIKEMKNSIRKAIRTEIRKLVEGSTDTLQKIKALGLSATFKDGEYRVNFKGGKEDTAYYTNDPDDAYETAKIMKKEGNKTEAAHPELEKVSGSITNYLVSNIKSFEKMDDEQIRAAIKKAEPSLSVSPKYMTKFWLGFDKNSGKGLLRYLYNVLLAGDNLGALK